MSEKFYGKYRGLVLNNIDPMQMGRLMVQVPDVTGLMPSTWAMPCVPVAGIQNGMFALPMIGSGVWVEYEQGDPDHPIWVGCFWGSAAEVPALARLMDKVWQEKYDPDEPPEGEEPPSKGWDGRWYLHVAAWWQAVALGNRQITGNWAEAAKIERERLAAVTTGPMIRTRPEGGAV